jgi:hypothetical protein
VVVSAAIGAAAHRNNPAGLWHLVVHSAGEQRGMKMLAMLGTRSMDHVLSGNGLNIKDFVSFRIHEEFLCIHISKA